MVVRTSTAEWHGRVQDGGGCVSLGSGAFEGPYSFGSRFEEEPGTNPEELLGAAHASCFSMALSLLLTEAGYTPTRIKTVAEVTIERSDDSFAITHIALVTEGDVPGLDSRSFSAHAEVARTTCPVSKALAAADITVMASLVERSAGIGPRRSAALRAAQQARAHFMTRRGSERFRKAR
ncbi:MAG TPA: OsmC family protein [Sphingomicrobium sp.]|nr:OsmC family protein [Sphingomicrobium sp.]